MKRAVVFWFSVAVVSSIMLAAFWLLLWWDAVKDWDKGWGLPTHYVDDPEPPTPTPPVSIGDNIPDDYRWDSCCGDFGG